MKGGRVPLDVSLAGCTMPGTKERYPVYGLAAEGVRTRDDINPKRRIHAKEDRASGIPCGNHPGHLGRCGAAQDVPHGIASRHVRGRELLLPQQRSLGVRSELTDRTRWAAIVTIAALVFSAGAVSFAKEKKRPDDAPPFEVVVELEQTIFNAEDSISMTATVYNNTDQNAIVDIAQLGARGKYDL